MRFSFIVYVFLLSFFGINLKSMASHLYGGEIRYEYVSSVDTNHTYKVTLILFGDCSAPVVSSLLTAIPAVALYKNGTQQNPLNLTVVPAESHIDITPICPDEINNNACANITSTIPGIKKFTYRSLCVLQGTGNWVFSFNGSLVTSIAGRSAQIGNLQAPASSLMALFATLNNTTGQNSSPVFTSPPTPFFCVNNPATYTLGAVDPDNDLMVYAMAKAKTVPTTVSLPLPADASYLAPYTYLQPFPFVPGTFNYNNVTGQMNFTPASPTSAAYFSSIVVNSVAEVRNGDTIGTSMREMTFVFMNNCSNLPPTYSIGNLQNGANAVINGAQYIMACHNQAGAISFNINAGDPAGDNITIASGTLPTGATSTITNNGTPNPVFSFNWNISGLTPGDYPFQLTLTDDGCPLIAKRTIELIIRISPKPTVTVSSTAPANKICNGNSTTLTASGAATYTWSPATGLSATAGTSVTANPTTTTTYTITGANVNGCTDVANITITVGNPDSGTASLVLCPSQLPTTWNGITIPATATTNPAYTTFTTTNAAGCDSTVALNLTINPSVTSTALLVLCPNQLPTTWNGIAIPTGATSNPVFTTYTATNVAGCDSIVTLNLTVNPSVTNTVFLTKCPSQLPTTWNGITIPAGATSNPAYTTYTATNVAGCDSIVTLNLTVNPSVTNTVFLTKCPNQLPTTWNGITIPAGATSNPVFTTYTATNVAGCDSIVTLNLTVNPSVTNTVFLTKCPSQLPTTWNGITIPAGATSNPAFTTYTTTNVAGCDSIVTLNLTVNPSVTNTVFLTKCPNQLPTTWNGITIPAGATSNPAYTTYTTTNVAGCDSIVTLNLTVNPSVNTSVPLTFCPSQLPATWNGITIPAGATSNPAYTTYTATNVAGCDSIVTLNLTVNPSVNTSVPLTFCPSQLPATWNGITILAGATSNPAYTTYTATNVAGCDSIVTLNLTVNPSVNTSVPLTFCPSQLPATWNGITIPAGATSNPVYTTYSATSALGCDSTVTLNLTINPDVSNSISATICNGQTYTFGTQTLNTTGTYTQVFAAANTCDSTVTLALTIKPPATTLHVNLNGCVSVVFENTTYTTSTELENIYTDVNGCDSVIRKVHITVKQPVINTIAVDICRDGSYTFNGATYNNTGTYADTFTAANGCDSISRLELTVHELPVVTLIEHGTEHPHYCLGDTVNLTASGADGYQWWWRDSSPSLGTGADKAVPLYANIQKIWVEGSDNYGCTDTAEIVIKAQGCCQLMMPNAFSPNGDGTNDAFGPETIGHPKGYAMRIYNRWGQMIYVSYKIDQKWDGTYNGQMAELGTYFYMVTGDCANGEPIQMKGDIILLR